MAAHEAHNLEVESSILSRLTKIMMLLPSQRELIRKMLNIPPRRVTLMSRIKKKVWLLKVRWQLETAKKLTCLGMSSNG